MTESATLKAVNKLLQIMAALRAENGCQWDRKQTPQSLKPYILEEAYELLEAIDTGDPHDICDELGDLLLQVVFQAQIFSEAEVFSLKDVADSISSKLERRHPHLFATANHEEHRHRWEEIKQQERATRGQSNKLADRIPNTLPALKRADKALKKRTVKDSYTDFPQVIDQLQALQRLQKNRDTSSPQITNLFGQILLSITYLAQTLEIDAEDSLRLATNKMIDEIDNSKALL